MKKQIVIIHGGMTFDTYEEYISYLNSCTLALEKINQKNWKEFMAERLPEFEVIYPKMPNSKNSRYPEWKIWFEKLFPILQDGVILVGHSLGGIFLAKFLSENDFPKQIAALHLVAAPYDDEDCIDSLADFALGENFNNLNRQVDKVFLYQSKDDKEVPFVDLAKYKKVLPNAKEFIFENRGHFLQEEFPELIESIKNN